jgi:hypothetical protein
MKKITAFLFFSILAALSLRAAVLFQDSTYYPSYTNGCVEGQGQWYCYYPTNSPKLDALITNNVLILNTTNKDSVATPTNGWVNSTEFNYASFSINVSQLPSSTNGGYFCQLQDTNDAHDCCHIFIDTIGTTVPGTFRLGIGSFTTTFSSIAPPVNYPMDLATGVTYTVVCLFDTNQNPYNVFLGSTLWINPSEQDYENAAAGDAISPGIGNGYVYGTDTTGSQALQNINISQIGFSPYANAGISNVIAATTFDEVNSTNLPVFGIQPQSGTNYSGTGNSATFYAVASGVDLNYRWYSHNNGILTDGGNIVGSTSNTLTINNLSVSDNYYAVVTDAYGNTATSATATNTVITDATAPFFPPSQPGQASTGGITVTNAFLAAATPFTNTAVGTGPLSYQWYFAPTNASTTFTLLGGQTSPTLSFSQLAYGNAGNYYVLASNSSGSTAGPTNTLVVIAPLTAKIYQLHQQMVTLKNGVSTNYSVGLGASVSLSGYVTTFSPLTATNSTKGEFYIQDSTGGAYVYNTANGGTNNTPPPGTYVTVTGPCQVYSSQLEIDPGTVVSGFSDGVVINSNVPPSMPPAQMGNFADLATNANGASGIQLQCSLVTLTNVYIYGTKTGGAYALVNFKTNSATSLYMTQGPYNNPNNTNYISLYVEAYGNGSSYASNFWNAVKVPTNAYQVTGVMENYSGASEMCVTRLQDIVTNPPPISISAVVVTNGVSTINWTPQTGSTYSVYTATNLSGTWTNQASGLSYFPVTGAYKDTNAAASMKFYRISTP